MKKQLLLLSLIATCFLFLKCGKDPLIPNGKVYVAGVELRDFYTDSSYTIAKLWIDGKSYDLPSSSSSAQAEDVFVANNIVYVAGSEYGNYKTRAVLWRNMQPIYLSAEDEEAQAFSVYVDGRDVYVSGLVHKNNIYKAVVWKNGVETAIADGISYPWEIVVSAGKQYVTVNKVVGDYLRPALMQANQLVMLETPAYTEYGEAFSVYVNRNNVYAVGTVYQSGKGNIAALWENGKLKVLATGNSNTTANDITMSASNDLYATGAINWEVVVWKNYQPAYLSKGMFSEGHSIALAGKDVYVAGTGTFPGDGNNNVPLLWKNSVVQELPTKSKFGIAYSVFVK